jgi:steroid 5-alpha reductase family enzyme
MDKVTDLAGGSNFVALSIITWMSGGNLSSLHCAINALVLIWGIRLSGYLFYRIIKIDEDKRFDGTRENPLKFLGFWIFQMIWV